MLRRQLFKVGDNYGTFDFLSTDGDDLGHVVSVSKDGAEILCLRVRMTARGVNMPAAEL